MDPTLFLKNLAQRLSNALPENVKLLKKDCEKNMHAILVDTFAKFDVVTREEFDVQTKVLARSRKKIEELEAHLTHLETMLQNQTNKSHDQ